MSAQTSHQPMKKNNNHYQLSTTLTTITADQPAASLPMQSNRTTME